MPCDNFFRIIEFSEKKISDLLLQMQRQTVKIRVRFRAGSVSDRLCFNGAARFFQTQKFITFQLSRKTSAVSGWRVIFLMWGFMTEDKSKPDQTMEDVQSVEDNEELIELTDSAEAEFSDNEPLIDLMVEAEPDESALASEPEEEEENDDEAVLLDNIVGEDIEDEELSHFEETILLDDIADEVLISDEDVVDLDAETDEEADLSPEAFPEAEGDDVIDLDADAIAAPRMADGHLKTAENNLSESEEENGDVIDLDADAIAAPRMADGHLKTAENNLSESEEENGDVIDLDTDAIAGSGDLEEKEEDVIELDVESVSDGNDVKEEKEEEDILEPDVESAGGEHDAETDKDREPEEFTDSDAETIIAPYGLEETVLMQPDVPKFDAGEEKDFIDLEAENILASDFSPGKHDAEETIFLGDAAGDAEDIPEPPRAGRAEKKQAEYVSSDEETIIAPYDIEDDSVLKPDAEEKDFIDLEAENILASDFSPGEHDAEETIFLGDAAGDAEDIPEPPRAGRAEKKQTEYVSSDEETIIAPYDIEDDSVLKPDAEEKDFIDLEAENILASDFSLGDFEKSDFPREAGPKKLRDEDSLDGMEDVETIIMPHSLEDADFPENIRSKPSNLKSASEDIDLQEDMGEILLTDDDIVDLPTEAILSSEELPKTKDDKTPPDDEVIDLGEDSIVEAVIQPKVKAGEEPEDTPPFDMEEVFNLDDNATIIMSDIAPPADTEIKGLKPEDSADDILPAEFLAGDTEGYQQQEKDLLELLEMDLDLKSFQPEHLLFDEIKEAEKEIEKTDDISKASGTEAFKSQEPSELKPEVKPEVKKDAVPKAADQKEETSALSDEIPLQDLEKEISSYPPEQLEAVLEQVIKRVFSEKAFSEKIEGKLVEVIEKAVAKEIDRLKDVLFEDIADDDLLN
jgi:hypothetical protein